MLSTWITDCIETDDGHCWWPLITELAVAEPPSLCAAVWRPQDLLQRLRSLESRLHLVEDESQSKDRQIQDLLSRLEDLVKSAGADAQGDLTQRLQVRHDWGRIAEVLSGRSSTTKRVNMMFDRNRTNILIHLSTCLTVQRR